MFENLKVMTEVWIVCGPIIAGIFISFLESKPQPETEREIWKRS